MTFPQSAAQLPLNYNFKTSGRRYEYVDMDFYPLYRFGYGLSYTTFAYSNLRISTLPDGNVEVKADITNTGSRTGDEHHRHVCLGKDSRNGTQRFPAHYH